MEMGSAQQWERGKRGCGRDWKSKQEPQTAPDASTTQIDANICIFMQEVQKESGRGRNKRTRGYMTIINMTQAHTTEMQHSHKHISASLGAIIENWGEGGSLTYHLIP